MRTSVTAGTDDAATTASVHSECVALAVLCPLV